MEAAKYILIGVIALQHLIFLYFEMFAWNTLGKKIFKGAIPDEMFQPTTNMAANQGLYNGFLAAGLIWSLCIGNPVWSNYTAIFFLSCVAIAGLFGGFTVSKKIVIVQALPAMIALVLVVVNLGFSETKDEVFIEKEIEMEKISDEGEKVMRLKVSDGSTEFDIETIVLNDESEVTITPNSGLEMKDKQRLHLEGTVTKADLYDLNNDGYSELILHTVTQGSGSYGSVKVFSPNNGISLSEAFLPELTEVQMREFKYMGHDVFSIEGGFLIRKFPIYLQGDSNSNPTGGVRKISYKLIDGEASRRFVIDKISVVK